MRKILIIPSSSYSKIKRRLHEIGLALRRRYQVFFLQWEEPSSASPLSKAMAMASNAFSTRGVYEKDGIIFARCPLMHRPLAWAQRFNAHSIQRLLIQQKIDVLINGIHYFFPAPEREKYSYKHIFDLNDLPTEETLSFLGRNSFEFAKKQAHHADAVTACSQGLADYASSQFGRLAHYIPNGANIAELKNINPQSVEIIRRQYNISGKFVIGYIGYSGDWVDIDLLIQAFFVFRQKRPDSALLIVGSGPQAEVHRKKSKDSSIIFTGGIEPHEIAAYFGAIDVGVIPSKRSFFQDVAFHLKLIEYTAANKPVISSPLAEVKRMNLPNVLIADLKVNEWVAAFEKARFFTWNPAGNTLVNDYDWQIIAEKFSSVIESLY